MPNFDKLSYDDSTGVLTWIVAPGRAVRAGVQAGTVTRNGYLSIRYEGKNYLVHRIAWYLSHGAWPVNDIDHINGDKQDNRLSNLRDASPSVNQQNQRMARRNNASGFLGVSKNYSKWQAQIMAEGKRKHLGTFNTPEKAHAAYLEAKRVLHPSCPI